jgi:hypothetical protein
MIPASKVLLMVVASLAVGFFAGLATMTFTAPSPPIPHDRLAQHVVLIASDPDQAEPALVTTAGLDATTGVHSTRFCFKDIKDAKRCRDHALEILLTEYRKLNEAHYKAKR